MLHKVLVISFWEGYGWLKRGFRKGWNIKHRKRLLHEEPWEECDSLEKRWVKAAKIKDQILKHCGGLTLAGQQVPIKAALWLPSSSGGGRENTTKGSMVGTNTGRDHTPVTVIGKTDSIHGCHMGDVQQEIWSGHPIYHFRLVSIAMPWFPVQQSSQICLIMSLWEVYVNEENIKGLASFLVYLNLVHFRIDKFVLSKRWYRSPTLSTCL